MKSTAYNDTMMVASMTIEQLKAEFLLIEQKKSTLSKTQRDLVISRLQWEASKDMSILDAPVTHTSFVTKPVSLWQTIKTKLYEMYTKLHRRFMERQKSHRRRSFFSRIRNGHQ